MGLQFKSWSGGRLFLQLVITLFGSMKFKLIGFFKD